MITHHLPYLLTKRIILASQSPRRREIIDRLGLSTCTEVIVSTFDESTLTKEEPRKYVMTSASKKAQNVPRTDGADLIIAADTVVVYDGRILEKPATEAQAIDFLKMLSGNHHSVLTGVSLVLCGKEKKQVEFVEETVVTFDALSDETIFAYVKSGEPMDKAGAYGIQGTGGSFVTQIKGCYFNVMGLPMYRVAKQLAALIEDGSL